MGYTLTRVWKQHDGAGSSGRRETSEGGETYAEAERRARTWWAGAASGRGAADASTVVDILDATGRTVACVRDSGTGTPALGLVDEAPPVTMRWLNYLRDIGVLTEPVRRSAERLSGMRSGDLASEVGGEVLDAYASRLAGLVFRVDGMLSHGLSGSGGDSITRLNVRRTIESTMDEADTDAFLAFILDGRIPVPPSTLPQEKVPGFLDALRRVSEAMLRVCEVVEAHARGEEPEPGWAPGR
jgi:hypothetical protein